ncbi:MAG: transcription termination/antitermination protein NusG [Clostridia bacterium]|nr:transcription termination/antitermination protein NusG [Clostridia bacterium]
MADFIEEKDASEIQSAADPALNDEVAITEAVAKATESEVSAASETGDVETAPVEPEAPASVRDDALWYVAHTYSGYENKVKQTLEQIVQNRNLQDFIQEIEVPVEEVVEIKEGKKKTSLRKIFPGYVLIKMVLNDDIWYIVRNTRGVTGFVGPNSKPVPLQDEELAMMGVKTDWVPDVDYEVGDSVKIISGPLESFMGSVEEINFEKKKVRLMVSMFGRETPVELDFTQVMRL